MKEVGNVEEIVKAINSNDGSFFFVPWIGKEYEKGLCAKKVLVVGASHYCNHTNVCSLNNSCVHSKNNYCEKGCKNFLLCTNSKTKEYDDKCEWMNDDNEHSCLYEKLCSFIKESSYDIKIKNKLSSNTLDEVCNFLDCNCNGNKTFSCFTDYCISYFGLNDCYDLWEHIAFVNYAQNFQPKSRGNKFKDSDFDAFKKYIEVINPDVVILWGCDLMHELEKRLSMTKSYNDYIWKLYTDSCLDGKKYLNSYHPSSGKFKDGNKLDTAMNAVFKAN